jgi:hypothetical protein
MDKTVIKDYAGSRALDGVCVCVEGQCYVSEHENQIMMKWKSIIDYKLIARWNVEIIKALKQSISFTYIHVRRGRGETRIRKFQVV